MPPKPESSVHLGQSAVGPLIRLAQTLHKIAQERKAKLAAQIAKSN